MGCTRWASFYTTVKWMELIEYKVSSANFCSDVHGYISTPTPRTLPTAHLQTYRAFVPNGGVKETIFLKKNPHATKLILATRIIGHGSV